MTNKVQISLILVTGLAVFGLGFSIQNRVLGETSKVNISNLKQMSTEDLKSYDGTDPTKPIYIGLNGLVYDVTMGKEFYIVGGVYHDLAGKDSSKALNLFGGAIIKNKYPVVAVLK